MKKYLFSGLAVIALCIIGAAALLLRPAQKNVKNTAPAELASWIQDADSAVFETDKNYFYVQEAIGSTGVKLQAPQKISGNFDLRFQVMSLTRRADIRFSLKKAQHIYDIVLSFDANTSKVYLQKDSQKLLEKDGTQINPDIYYDFNLTNENGKISFAVNNNNLLDMQLDNTPFDLAIELTGEPDDPAAIQIQNMQIFEH